MSTQNKTSQTYNNYTRRWWKESVVYQIYPRSFKDANGDGIGDLQGIISELDYIKNLGIDIIWLSPIFDSPNADNGYDIRDYRKIMTEFGTMADFNALLEGVKSRGMKLILDLVANHSSDEHAWFAESKSAKDNPYRDYYIWRPAKNGGTPNNWISYFSGDAWTLDEKTNEYYLHLFDKKQPDLNWENPIVRQEVYDIMTFWLDKGVDGFRMDVIPFISKDQSFPNFPADFDGDFGRVYASGPKLHDYIQEMHREVMSKYDMMTVGEAAGTTLADTPLMIDERRNELNMIFQFDIVTVDRKDVFWDYQKHVLRNIKDVYARYESALDKHCWNAIFISNHDNPRPVSRFGDDSARYRVRSAKLLATMLLTQKGTPFIYQGDEMGMTNYPFTDVSQYDDIQVRNAWQYEIVERGGDAKAFLENVINVARDHSRTTMQWSNSKNGGFSTADKTWFVGNKNYATINARAVERNKDSVYHYFRKLIALRRKHLGLIYGDFALHAAEHENIFAYTRTTDTENYFVALNFSDKNQTYTLPEAFRTAKVIFGNVPRLKREANALLPWQAIILMA